MALGDGAARAMNKNERAMTQSNNQPLPPAGTTRGPTSAGGVLAPVGGPFIEGEQCRKK